jgi:hypothetical protein
MVGYLMLHLQKSIPMNHSFDHALWFHVSQPYDSDDKVCLIHTDGAHGMPDMKRIFQWDI